MFIAIAADYVPMQYRRPYVVIEGRGKFAVRRCRTIYTPFVLTGKATLEPPAVYGPVLYFRPIGKASFKYGHIELVDYYGVSKISTSGYLVFQVSGQQGVLTDVEPTHLFHTLIISTPRAVIKAKTLWEDVDVCQDKTIWAGVVQIGDVVRWCIKKATRTTCFQQTVKVPPSPAEER